MDKPALPADTDSSFDSDRLLALESEVNRGANNLIVLSALTLLCGLWLGPLLAFEGAAYLVLAIVLRTTHSRVAALALFFAAVAAVVPYLLAFLGLHPAEPLIGFAIPEVAPLVAGWTAYKAFRLERLLQAPLSSVRPQARGV
jgi:hypothetical protein